LIQRSESASGHDHNASDAKAKCAAKQGSGDWSSSHAVAARKERPKHLNEPKPDCELSRNIGMCQDIGKVLRPDKILMNLVEREFPIGD